MFFLFVPVRVANALKFFGKIYLIGVDFHGVSIRRLRERVVVIVGEEIDLVLRQFLGVFEFLDGKIVG